MRQFSHEYPQIDKEWFDNSNYICLLVVSNEEELNKLLQMARDRNIACSSFREEDLGNALTAVCLEPGRLTKKLVSNIKLAFSS